MELISIIYYSFCYYIFSILFYTIYVLIKKGWTPVKCILLILVVGIVGCAFGIFAGDSKAMDDQGNTIPGGYTPLVEWYELPAEE